MIYSSRRSTGSDYIDPVNEEIWGGTSIPSPWVVLGNVEYLDNLLFEEFTNWVSIPKTLEPLSSPLPEMISEIRDWTGWSQRDLGEVLHTSHTTVRRLETEGRVTSRTRATASQIPALHSLMRRLHYTTRSQPQRLASALTVPGFDNKSATQLLIEGRFARAYSLALEVLRGGRSAMVTPDDQRRLPDATVELL